ncbi:phosphatase PAP2 family protein [Rhodopirellula sp. MGV]|uniref:phosphatase PAP2 family protein n=1 Tax=Rhodopirellula sp. MGV TaxID=2023130 RepID=UPI001E62298B|nr:phosphatase PAP2 family protein [Rhodopirellula sp. MGV]
MTLLNRSSRALFALLLLLSLERAYADEFVDARFDVLDDVPTWVHNPTADPSIKLITASLAWDDEQHDAMLGELGISSEPLPEANPIPLANEPYDPSWMSPPFRRRKARLARELSQGQPSLWKEIQLDHLNYYDLETIKLLGTGMLIGAAIANTSLDAQVERHFQASVRGATSDEWFEYLHSSKELGNGRYSLPIFAAAWAAGEVFDDSPMMQTTGTWGKRTIRSFLVGAPPLILAQHLTGGSRPHEINHASRWRPMHDNNGVSGHAFMSALPFINAAKMTDRPLLKTMFYAGSLLGPISRVNDQAHYPSQVALGWWMAYVASSAIERTDLAGRNFAVYPYVAETGAMGGMLEWNY